MLGKTWGNGATQPSRGEECDDGNTVSGDGCSSTWTIESGFTWIGFPKTVWSACPNQAVDGSEQWDDGNRNNGDGWSSQWLIETGWYWNGASPSICYIWGNGTKGNKECDDGNTISGDGWSSTCTVESGYTCGDLSPSVWSPIWGDNIIISPYEQCDDGNLIDGDGCSSLWVLETGASIGQSSSGSSTVGAVWGNNILEGTEECDDGNLVDGDGCDSLWNTENPNTGGGNNNISNFCGNQIIEGTEEWDDGNNNSNDGCSSNWVIENNYEWSEEPSNCKVSLSQTVVDSAISTIFLTSVGFGKYFISYHLYRTFYSATDFINSRPYSTRNLGNGELTAIAQIHVSIHSVLPEIIDSYFVLHRSGQLW